MNVINKIFLFLNNIKNFAAIQKFFMSIAICIFLYFLILILISFLEKIIKKNNWFLKNKKNILKQIKSLLFYTIFLLFGTYLIDLLKLHIYSKLFYAIMIFFISIPIKNLFESLILFFKTNIASKTESKVDDIIFDILNKFTGLIVFICATILALNIIGINIMPFVAGASVMGMAIGFAAKDTLSNLIAGVLLMIDRPFEVGNRIGIWDNLSESSWGDVVEIGIRATKIRTPDNTIIIIPNNKIMTRDITNYTISSPEIRIRINVGISYNADINEAKNIILKIAKNTQGALKSKEPKVVIIDFGASSIDMQLRIWIENALNKTDIRSVIIDKIKTDFDKAKIEIPFPQVDMNIKRGIKNEDFETFE